MACDIPTPILADHPRAIYQSRDPRSVGSAPLDDDVLPRIRCDLAAGCPQWISGWDLSASAGFTFDGSVCCPTADGRILYTGASDQYDLDWRTGAGLVGTHYSATHHVRVGSSVVQRLSGTVLGEFEMQPPPSIHPCGHQIASISRDGGVEWIALYDWGARPMEGGNVYDLARGELHHFIRDDRDLDDDRRRLVTISVANGEEVFRSAPFEFPAPSDGSPAYLLEGRQMVYSAAFQAGVFDGSTAHPIELGLGTRRTAEYDIPRNNPPIRIADGTVLLSSDAGYQWIDTEARVLLETDTWVWRVGRGQSAISAAPPIIHPDGSYYQAMSFGMVRYDRSQPVADRVRVFGTGQLFKSPMVARDGVVIAVSTDAVTAFAPGPDPQILWSVDVFPGPHATGVLLDDGVLVFATRDGALYVLQTAHHGLARTPMPTWRGDNHRSGTPPPPPYDTTPTQEPLWRFAGAGDGSGEGSGATP